MFIKWVFRIWAQKASMCRCKRGVKLGKSKERLCATGAFFTRSSSEARAGRLRVCCTLPRSDRTFTMRSVANGSRAFRLPTKKCRAVEVELNRDFIEEAGLDLPDGFV